MTEKLNIVFEYLQGKIADLKDVNRQHIKIKSVSDAVKKDYDLRDGKPTTLVVG